MAGRCIQTDEIKTLGTMIIPHTYFESSYLSLGDYMYFTKIPQKL